MNRKNKLKLSAFLPAIIGLIIGAILFWLGYMDDAPGLCLIGIATAFLLMLWSGCNVGLLKKTTSTCYITMFWNRFSSIVDCTAT